LGNHWQGLNPKTAIRIPQVLQSGIRNPENLHFERLPLLLVAAPGLE
jgi:hypothetical protein